MYYDENTTLVDGSKMWIIRLNKVVLQISVIWNNYMLFWDTAVVMTKQQTDQMQAYFCVYNKESNKFGLCLIDWLIDFGIQWKQAAFILNSKLKLCWDGKSW
jgi:hypothetical protein